MYNSPLVEHVCLYSNAIFLKTLTEKKEDLSLEKEEGKGRQIQHCSDARCHYCFFPNEQRQMGKFSFHIWQVLDSLS